MYLFWNSFFRACITFSIKVLSRYQLKINFKNKQTNSEETELQVLVCQVVSKLLNLSVSRSSLVVLILFHYLCLNHSRWMQEGYREYGAFHIYKDLLKYMAEGPFSYPFQHLNQQKAFCPSQEADGCVDQIHREVVKLASATFSSSFKPHRGQRSHILPTSVCESGVTPIGKPQ